MTKGVKEIDEYENLVGQQNDIFRQLKNHFGIENARLLETLIKLELQIHECKKEGRD